MAAPTASSATARAADAAASSSSGHGTGGPSAGEFDIGIGVSVGVGRSGGHGHKHAAAPPHDADARSATTALTADNAASSQSSHLLSIANYGPFAPAGLACCTGLARSEFGDDENGDDEDQRQQRRGDRDGPASGYVSAGGRGAAPGPPQVSFSASTSAAAAAVAAPPAASFTSGTAMALAGRHGIAIVRSHRPHVPSVVLSHSTPAASAGSGGGSSAVGPMAFQPANYEMETNAVGGNAHAPTGAGAGGGGAAAASAADGTGSGRSTLLLATARGSGVLVWDASGRSLSPLLGRLGHDGRHPPASQAATATASATVSNASSAAGNVKVAGGSASTIIAGSSNAAATGIGIGMSTNSNNIVSPLPASPRPSPAGSVQPSPNKTTTATISYDLNRITSLAWLSAHTPTLVTTSARSACVWDLRCPSISRLRPAMRWELPPSYGGGGGGSGSSDGEFVSCASGGENGCEIATLDGSGVVRIYDARMVGGGSSSGSSRQQQQRHLLHAFYAYDSAGVGIHRLPLSSTSGRKGWLTWGFDGGDFSEGSVKVWREQTTDAAAAAALAESRRTSNDLTIDSEDYWNPNPTPEGSEIIKKVASHATDGGHGRHYELTAIFGTTGGLSTARVVPYPFLNSVVTVGTGQGGDWRADYWTLDERENMDDSGTYDGGAYGARLEASFEGGYGADESLKQVLGRSTDLGHLIQADLAVGPPAAQGMGQLGGAELVLCCLSSTGYLTTHAIPEANDQLLSASAALAPSSPRRQLASHRLIRPDLAGVDISEEQSKMFKSNSDSDMHQRNLETVGGLRAERRDQRYSSEISNDDALGYNRSSALAAKDDSGIDPISNISRGVEGALMQFEIDVPATLSADISGCVAGNTPLGVTATQGAIDASGTGNDTEQQPNSAAARPTAIDPFRAMNVPCPRMCGATFGHGGGGIIVFNNGDVRKLWSWFQKEQEVDSKQQQQSQGKAFGAVTQTSSTAPLMTRNSLKNTTISQSPRTMLDLMRMNAAAKIAQWGVDGADDEGDSDKESDRSDDESEVSDDSSQSSSESEEFESFFLQQQALAEKDFKEDSTLETETTANRSSSQLSTGGKDTSDSITLSSSPPSHRFSIKHGGRRSSTEPTLDADDAFINPSLDHLAPVVTFTQRHDTIVMNRQCPELADSMEFGPWRLSSQDETIRPTQSTRNMESSSGVSSRSSGLHSEGWGWTEDSTNIADSDTSDANEDSPYRSIFPSLSAVGRRLSMKAPTASSTKAESTSTLTPTKSLPSIQLLNAAEPAPMLPRLHSSLIQSEEKQKRSSSITGGFNSLFYSQSPESIAVVPPDQNMLPAPKVRSRPPSRAKDSFTEVTSVSDALGVHMVASPDELSPLAILAIERTVDLCLYNAAACKALGQSEKADTWELLAQVVDQLSNDNRDSYDGWGGLGGGALGTELVENVLQFYELHGDVQMLATIVCVLSGGSDRRMSNRNYLLEQETNSCIRKLLPVDDKCLDSYIIRYSSLLYAWGKLTTRTELNKHLAHVTPGGGGEMLIPLGKAFKCSICENAVRGLFTTCMLCGHGGHVEHVLPWFERETTCPTGCGCSCVLTTYTSETVLRAGSDRLPGNRVILA